MDDSENSHWNYHMSYVPETCFDSDPDVDLTPLKPDLQQQEVDDEEKKDDLKLKGVDDVENKLAVPKKNENDDSYGPYVLNSYDSERVDRLVDEDEVTSPKTRRLRKRTLREVPQPPRKRKNVEVEDCGNLSFYNILLPNCQKVFQPPES